ncbi:MAG: BON domain-containing protein [Pseudomonadota bacterium]
MTLRHSSSRLLLAALAATALAGVLSACAPLIVGAAAGTALVATDRRTSGAQLEDERIELRAASSLRDAFGERAHINVSSYNRQVLLTGEVPNDQAKQQAEQVVMRVENVRGVFNELAVMGNTTLTQRSNDVLITGKVKALLVDAADVQVNAFRVVTERGIVYLMGRVTPREADRATQITRNVGGVARVVRLFEPLSETDLRQPARAAQPASAPRS